MSRDIAAVEGPQRPDRGRAPHRQAQPRLLRHRRLAGRQQHRARHLPPHHRARVPPVPAAPGVRGGDPHPRLPVHRREPGPATKARSSTPTTRCRSIREKDEFLVPFIDTLTDPAFKTGTPEADQQPAEEPDRLLLPDGGPVLLRRLRPDPGAGPAEQDDRRRRAVPCTSCATSPCTAISASTSSTQIKLENPHLWTAEFQRGDARAVPQGGASSSTATPRTPCRAACWGSTPRCSRNTCASSPTAAASRSAWTTLFPGAANPFPWMSEMIDLKKETQLLRDPGDRVPDRRRAELGLGLHHERGMGRDAESPPARPKRTTSCGCASRTAWRAACSSATCSRSARSSSGATCASSRK